MSFFHLNIRILKIDTILTNTLLFDVYSFIDWSWIWRHKKIMFLWTAISFKYLTTQRCSSGISPVIEPGVFVLHNESFTVRLKFLIYALNSHFYRNNVHLGKIKTCYFPSNKLNESRIHWLYRDNRILLYNLIKCFQVVFVFFFHSIRSSNISTAKKFYIRMK